MTEKIVTRIFLNPDIQNRLPEKTKPPNKFIKKQIPEQKKPPAKHDEIAMKTILGTNTRTRQTASKYHLPDTSHPGTFTFPLHRLTEEKQPVTLFTGAPTIRCIGLTDCSPSQTVT